MSHKHLKSSKSKMEFIFSTPVSPPVFPISIQSPYQSGSTRRQKTHSNLNKKWLIERIINYNIGTNYKRVKNTLRSRESIPEKNKWTGIQTTLEKVWMAEKFAALPPSQSLSTITGARHPPTVQRVQDWEDNFWGTSDSMEICPWNVMGLCVTGWPPRAPLAGMCRYKQKPTEAHLIQKEESLLPVAPV